MKNLTISLIVVALIATVGLGWLFDQFYDEYTQATDGNSSDAQALDAVSTLEQLGADLALTLDSLPSKKQFVAQWQSNNQYSLILMHSDDLQIPASMMDDIKQGKPLLLETDVELSIHYYLPSTRQLLILSSPLVKLQEKQSSLQYFLTFLFYALLLLLFLLWVSPLLIQLKRLRKAAKSFGEGHLEQRIDMSSASYIRDIESEFNHMAQRIENLVSDVKLLSSAVSHDLRTPLAKIRFGIDTLEEESDPERQRQYLSKISKNVDEMTSLVESLLHYSRLDQNMVALEKEKTDISKIISACIANANNLGVSINFVKTEKPYFVLADKSTMHMLFTNLIQNAIHYGEGHVLIEINSEQGNIIVNISDDGDGVPEANRQDVFKPFYRGDLESNAKHIKGHGIGLAIAKRILDWHHGKIVITDSVSLKGANFRVCLKEYKTK